ncbi:hypothetical protein EJB05_56453 [Eragrostis curvula]|uniref:Uncharacterized protein n=1 Tax=Eragrostis curvula TaxID=38414 RepID=A0A5J9SG29_9POAL|nr:hypothetical protein EJB05_56453 [Eragrostis curvula]
MSTSRSDPRDLEKGLTKAGGSAVAEDTELVVTKPRMVRLINISAVIFSVVLIINLIYNVYVFFETEVTTWEVVAWSAVVLPLCIVPLCLVPMLRKEFIHIYAMGPSDSSSTQITQRLLSPET